MKSECAPPLVVVVSLHSRKIYLPSVLQSRHRTSPRPWEPTDRYSVDISYQLPRPLAVVSRPRPPHSIFVPGNEVGTRPAGPDRSLGHPCDRFERGVWPRRPRPIRQDTNDPIGRRDGGVT